MPYDMRNAETIIKNNREHYFLVQNGFGQYWPCLKVCVNPNDAEESRWCEIIIRNSNPFKTRNGAIKFINKIIIFREKKEVNYVSY